MTPKSLVLVEDLNDAEIFKAILAQLNPNLEVAHFELGMVFDKVDTDPNPKKPTALITKLKTLINDFRNGKPDRVDRVGIVLDMDNSTKEVKLAMLNLALKSAYPNCDISPEFADINQFVNVTWDKGKEEETAVGFVCHFINMGGKGEIEDLLLAIKSSDSSFADCLGTCWVACFSSKGKVLSEESTADITYKELKKYQIDVYKRFDVLPRNKRGENNTKWGNFLKNNPQAFDFGKDEVIELKELKDFLRLLEKQ